jgi:mono/diheme cytochrome c family protein
MCTSDRLVLALALLAPAVVLSTGCTASGGAIPSTATTAASDPRIPGARPAPPPPPGAAPRETGRALFATLCSPCHGLDGRGATALARDLEPHPADLGACSFKLRSTPSGSLPADADLLRTISVGLPGAAMPSFAALLPLPSLLALVAEAKEPCGRFRLESPEPPLDLPVPTVFTAASVAAGRRVYDRERCASCHGDAGRGDGPAAAALRDAQGRPIRPRDHTRGVFRGGFRRVDLVRAFSTGLDGTPMPALAETVSASDRVDLANHLADLSRRRCGVARALDEPPTFYEPVRAFALPWQ